MAAADKGANVEVRVSLRGLPRTLVEKRSVFVIVRGRGSLQATLAAAPS